MISTFLLLLPSALIQSQTFGEWVSDPVLTLEMDFRPLSAMALVPDINGDGISEVLTGAPFAGVPDTLSRGTVLLHSGLDGGILLRIDGQTRYDHLGATVAVAGDLDGDGLPDLLAARISFGPVVAYSSATGAIIRYFDPPVGGTVAPLSFGATMHGIPDADGDGVDDVLIGAPDADVQGMDRAGAVFLYSGATGVLVRTFTGSADDDSLGRSLAPAGDLDLDGVPDFIVGATRVPTTGHATVGRALVLSGGTGVVIHSFAAPTGLKAFGFAVAGGEDMDGDGVPDLLVGAPFHRSNSLSATLAYSGATGATLQRFDGALGDESGSSVAFAGDLTGNGVSEILIGAPGAEEVRVFQADGAWVSTVTSPLGSGAFGSRVSGEGRFDNDGIPDWIVLAPRESAQGWASGSVRVHSGASSSEILSILGDARTPRTGATLAQIGDWNRDGIEDLAVGSPGATLGAMAGTGTVLILSGSDTRILARIEGWQAGAAFGAALVPVDDRDGDGVPDLVVGAPQAEKNGIDAGALYWVGSATRSVVHSLSGTVPGERFGHALASIADLNGDGWRDLVVGAPRRSSSSGRYDGAVYIVSGRDGAILQSVIGQETDAQFGYSVAAGGDADRDGFPDWLAGAPFANLRDGRVDLYSGRTGGLLRTFEEPPTGSNHNDLGHALAWIGDVDGDLHDDFIAGSPGTMVAGINWAGSALVYSGATGSLLHRVDGTKPYQYLGQEVAAAGDLDLDGVLDFAIGSPGWSFDGADSGKVELHSGASGALLASIESPGVRADFGHRILGTPPRYPGGPGSLLVGAPAQGMEGGAVYLVHLDPFLHLSGTQISAASGAFLELGLGFPGSEAGMFYAVLASATGTGPSLVAGIEFPLTQDRLFQLSGTPAAAVYLPGHQGRLDANGDASLTLSFGPGVLAPLVGRTLYLAALSGSDPQTGRLSSAARWIWILP